MTAREQMISKDMETEKHQLDNFIYNYYRVCELNNKVPVLIDYKIEQNGHFVYLTFRVNRRPSGVYCFSSENECKDAVVESYFIKGIESLNNQ